MASLVVDAVTFLITDISKQSLAGMVARWLGMLH